MITKFPIRQFISWSGLAAATLGSCVAAAEVTFFSYSDIHYGADDGGRKPPIVKSENVPLINGLPGTAYPAAIGGVVAVPRGILMQGDLINDGAVKEKYPAQWANYVADFGVSGEGRCKFPVYEGVGNHDVNPNLFVFNQVKERNVTRQRLGMIQHVSDNGYHYSWDWDGVHFVNVNLFPGNVWEGEADAYGRGHDPLFARDFLIADLRRNVGNSGRPVIIMQHFRPIDENWWTYSAADRYHQVLQDYNVVAIVVGHQGGGVNNLWRGYNWISSNGELVICRIQGDTFSAVSRSATEWGTPLRKKLFYSYAESGLPTVVNNGSWATHLTATGATLSAKLVYEAAAPTEVTLHWGTADGGTDAAAWQQSKKLGVQAVGTVATADITGLQPWTTYYYRAAASNGKGVAWAGASIPFHTAGILPAGWQTEFIGHAQRPGSGATFADGVFTVRGSGRDIAEGPEAIDNFQFAYQNLAGDGEIKARIATAEVKSREPKIGIMLRESVAAGSKNVALLMVPRVGVRLSARLAADGRSSSKMMPLGKTPPCWVKLTRRGNTFTGSVSEDGETWQQVGAPVTVEMKAELCAGLAVTAGCRDESKLHTSAFDHVSVSKP
jgi:hypothetical protein